MGQSFFSTWKKSFDYSGISTRKEFWVFVVTTTIIIFPLALAFELMSILLIILGDENSMPLLNLSAGFIDFLGYFYFWGSYVVFWSLSVRRLRDLGKSWKWVFVLIIPIVNLIPMFLWFTKTSLKEEVN